MAANKVIDLLGSEGEALLNHECKTISKVISKRERGDLNKKSTCASRHFSPFPISTGECWIMLTFNSTYRVVDGGGRGEKVEVKVLYDA